MTTLLLAFASPFLCAAVWLVIWLVPLAIALIQSWINAGKYHAK